MRKKILAWLLAVTFVASIAYAAQSVKQIDGTGTALDGRIFKTFWLTSTNQGYYIPSTSNGEFSHSDTSIQAGKHAIIGWSILYHVAGAEFLATLYDDDSLLVGRGILMNEAEVTATETRPIWFPHARGLEHGLVIRQGGGTHIAIHYVDIR